MFRRMLEDDRLRAGWSMGQAAWRLGVSIREYRELEAGVRWPDWETFDHSLIRGSTTQLEGPRDFAMRRIVRFASSRDT